MATREKVRKQDALIQVRCYREELEQAKNIAVKYRQTLAEMVRQVLKEEARRAKIAPQAELVDEVPPAEIRPPPGRTLGDQLAKRVQQKAEEVMPSETLPPETGGRVEAGAPRTAEVNEGDTTPPETPE